MNNSPYVTWVHSCYVNNGIEDAIVVKEKVINQDGSSEPKLKIYANPKRRFWLTKPKYRDHTDKKEYETKDKLDEYLVYEKDLAKEIYKELNGYYPFNDYVNLKQVCNSPYVYGADIPVEVLCKLKYLEKTPEDLVVEYIEGFLDIETCVLNDEGNIIIITVSHENKIFTAIDDNYLYKNRQKHENPVKANLDDVKEIVNNTLAKEIEEHKLEITYYLGKNELELVTWIFERIHENKTDFIGIWNIDFDLPKIIEAIKKSGKDPKDILAHPDVPKKFRKAEYVPQYVNPNSKKKTPFIEKWHWFYSSGHTQFIDSMCLYSRIRKVGGFFDSYTLNDTLERELGLRKLSLGEEDSHYVMQKYRFLDYIAYNIYDTLGLYFLEKQNKDIYAMSVLVGTSIFNQFAYQTVMGANELYEYAKSIDAVMGSPGNKMITEASKLIVTNGGTVLRSEKTKGVGENAILEDPNRETLLSVLLNDIDFEGFYPKTQIGSNIAKETKRMSIVAINGAKKAVNYLFALLISTKENAVHICTKYFNAPNFKQVDKIVERIRANNIKTDNDKTDL
jgi:hypothetical protein